VPIATKGIFTLTSDAFDNDADGVPSCVPGTAAVISPETAGTVSGVAFSTLYGAVATSVTGLAHVTQGGTKVKYTPDHVVGTWIGSGTRTSVGPITDVHAGAYGVLKLNV
jgi:hypothetical protein